MTLPGDTSYAGEGFDPTPRAEVLRAEAEREKFERLGEAALKILSHPDAPEGDCEAAQAALEASNLYGAGSFHAAWTKVGSLF